MSTEETPQDKQARAQAKEAERLARRAATSARTREKIEKQIAQKELEHQQEALVRRLDIAKLGIRALTRESFGEATKSFLVYLAMLEKAKKVEGGRLHPSQFDPKKEMVELVLVTGIYWDLARTYDRMRGKAHVKEMQVSLNQFVVFAKDASYKALCAETLRKYLAAEKALHRGDFKAAYKRLGGTTCFIASSLLDVADLETLPRLRAFRDERLARTAAGRAFIRRYELHSPRMATLLEHAPAWVRIAAARVLDLIAVLVSGTAFRSGSDGK
jgi:hypothetical protein